jgi:RNA polymerase sigma factor (sigma-70 family)
MLKTQARQPDHQEAFLQRYTRLRSWARALVQNDPQQAEDLLHDVFLQFTVSHPDLKAIANLDGYLRRMLQNMHLSHLRRMARMTAATRSLLDYESASAGLEVLKRETEAQARDELRRICEYALARKNTSKIASVLILRFFHGYYAVEIAQILRESRGAVDQALSRARTEAKAYITDPNSLAFMAQGAGQEKRGDESKASDAPTEDLLLDLRDHIFSSASGVCFSMDQLTEVFRAGEGEINTVRLSHLVSCRGCLDQVNQLLDLPPISARYPTKTLNKDKRTKKDGRGGPPSAGGAVSGDGGDSDDFVASHNRRLKDLLEHRPQELRIAVNGFVLGTQSVTSELCNQALSVNLEERISFVEVFSEREVRLLFCGVEPPPEGQAEYRNQIELSDGRRLDVQVDFAESRPQVNVTYRDPTFGLVPTTQNQNADQERQEQLEKHSLPLISRRAKLSRDSFSNRLTTLIRSLRAVIAPGFLFRPGVVTALFALIMIATALLYLRMPTTSLSATEILRRSTLAEESIAARPDQVVHRTITLEEIRRPQSEASNREVLSRRRIEFWQNGAEQIALRVYDEKNQLVNGQWIKGGVSRVLLHHGSKLQLYPGAKPSQSSLAFSDTWQLVPSGKTFVELIHQSDKATFSETSTEYAISYQSDTAAVDGLQRATLVLSRPDLRAVKQTLTVRQGGEVREYVFSESSFEQRPVSAVAPAIFEPDPELLSSAKPEPLNPKSETNTTAPSTAGALPVTASPELELEVVRQLNQANAFLGEQISVERTAEGQLKVKGIVDSAERKNELLQSLAAFKTNPAVKIDIATVAEAVKRQKQSPSGPVTVTQVESGKAEIPVEAELRQYFSKRGVGADQLDQEVQRFSARVLNHSFQARRHALAMKQIAERFSLDDLRALDPLAKANWRAMLAQHARSLQQETASLRRELEQAFTVLAAGNEAGIDVTNDETIVRAAQQLFALSVSNDDNMHRSFAVFAGKQGAAPVKTAQFWHSLKSAEALAGVISRQ